MSKKKIGLVERHIEALKTMKTMSAEAGWFESARYKAGKKANGQPISKDLVGTPVAKIARVQEFGATIVRKSEKGSYTIIIPPRPFMRMAAMDFNKQKDAVQHVIAAKILAGAITPEQGIGQIALFMEGCIVNAIKNGGWAPNAKSTADAKGFNKPLIDSAQMWQSVTSKVNK